MSLEGDGSRVRTTNESARLSGDATQECLQNLGQAVVNLQRDQSKFFEEVIYRLESQDQTSKTELLEIIDRRMDLRERRQREEDEIAHTASFIDQCGRQGANSHSRQTPQCFRADLEPIGAESGSGHRGRYDPQADSSVRPSSWGL